MTLAVAAGANLPAIWCDRLLGRARLPALARAGLRYRWEDADLRNARWLARRDYRGALAAARPRSGVVHAFFRRDDPGPLAVRAPRRRSPRRLGAVRARIPQKG